MRKKISINIVFPATSCSAEEIIEIKKYLKNLDMEPKIFFERETTPRRNSNCSLPEYSPKERFNQLYQSLKDKNSSIIWCVRGGYGSADLLPFLKEAKKIKQKDKIFIGFSDITSIANFLQERWGWKIIMGPMLIQLIKDGKLKITSESKKEMINIIKREKTSLSYPLKALNQMPNKNINATIIGGCMSVFCSHFGTEFQNNLEDKILFLEDIGEEGEKLERNFNQIINFILTNKQKPKAILLGEFCYNMDKIRKANVKLAINSLLDKISTNNLEIPVFQSKIALGHSDKMMPLSIGSKSKIDIRNLKMTNAI